MKIESLRLEEIVEAGNLIRQVFDEFVASDYSKKGVRNFYEIISPQAIRERFVKGSIINVCKSNDRIVGYIEIRNFTHIYLLFVSKEYQQKRVAGKLLEVSLDMLKVNNPGLSRVTVNSTPSAVKVYEKLGFSKMADYQIKNGIISFPMFLTPG